MNAEELASLTLEHLRAIRSDIGDLRNRMTGVESRLSSLETTVAGMRRDLAHMYGDVVEGHTRMDQLAARVERIEAELETAGPEGLALAGRVATADYTWRYVVTRLRISVMIYR